MRLLFLEVYIFEAFGFLASLVFASYYNDYLTVIRGVFKLVHKSADKSPARLLENKKRVKDEPDPFSIDESNEIIATTYKEYGLQSGCWFHWAFIRECAHPEKCWCYK